MMACGEAERDSRGQDATVRYPSTGRTAADIARVGRNTHRLLAQNSVANRVLGHAKLLSMMHIPLTQAIVNVIPSSLGLQQDERGEWRRVESSQACAASTRLPCLFRQTFRFFKKCRKARSVVPAMFVVSFWSVFRNPSARSVAAKAQGPVSIGEQR
ncbi:hypothetical protein SNOG_03944 [Parastagonospora nodorum SN15]|uniref:Uncharacterized protein n=1 Tax=Phaeosphaeria nodorum (strain SN15 / ATCC MYA-4574 / FGSC 10173) TaxID=321614 RepID=Q0UWC0_PHANO|nr:hypothetical protein SNOG_03944 [Parastagonospora nodorum SN15]EAT89149.1 hypothetical protein SNOG_03944 [Parastagonospora nodorum SN15]